MASPVTIKALQSDNISQVMSQAMSQVSDQATYQATYQASDQAGLTTELVAIEEGGKA